eukprot:CAMPEP_0172623358 /NCGR_PEP_ID=MMETSP1068-20121228/127923_1 /TAXON_ID=35684 /ORGANISM="Pseudopedinella elastica, Strain CCMP716" /LENGTH=168 /DNA_ID=CAMNT_0013431895 /DNA_START=15 /DNA_END=517 /DNA_ORIENTATION=+
MSESKLGRPKRQRVLNCYGMGNTENGRLGIGPPDDARMIAEAGFPVGWHQPVEEETRVDPKISNVRARRTHKRGLLRLAKLPAGLPEEAVGATGGVVHPTAVGGNGIKTEGPRCVSLATGEKHTLVLLEDGKMYGWGDGSEGQLGRKVIEQAIAKEEARKLAKKKTIT